MSGTVTRTRITHRRSYGSRVSSSFCAILFCPIFVFLGSWLLIWNEGFSIKQHRALTEGSKLVVDVTKTVDVLDPKLNNMPVHFTGLATTDGSDDPLVDPIFGVTPSSSGALKLQRYVEMYQWTEASQTQTIKNSDGSTDQVTTYSYSTEWEDHVINSNTFYENWHENPDSMRFETETFTAEGIHVGAFSLTHEVLDYMDWFQRIPSSYLHQEYIPDARLRSETSVYHNYLYYSVSGPMWPQVGDTRVSFFQVPSQVISVVAMQNNNGVPTSYEASNGNTFLLVEQGEHSTEVMFENAHRAVSIQNWLLRLLGFIVIWIGFKSLLQPMAVTTSCIPCIGDLTETVANSVSFLLGFCVSIVIIALAWLWYRPLLSVSLIMLALCCGFCGMPHRDDAPTTAQNMDESEWYDEVPTVQAIPLVSEQNNGIRHDGDYQSSGYQKQEAAVTDQRLSYSNITPIPVSHAMTYGETVSPSKVSYGATAPPDTMDKYR